LDPVDWLTVLVNLPAPASAVCIQVRPQPLPQTSDTARLTVQWSYRGRTQSTDATILARTTVPSVPRHPAFCAGPTYRFRPPVLAQRRGVGVHPVQPTVCSVSHTESSSELSTADSRSSETSPSTSSPPSPNPLLEALLRTPVHSVSEESSQ
jgi:hypothetical protein